LSLSGSASGSVVVVPCGAMVPCCGIDCVGRATRRIPRGRWRGRLSRWRRWRRRSLRGCRAGCHQSYQDQKKRLSLHGEQMLPRYRCSLLGHAPLKRGRSPLANSRGSPEMPSPTRFPERGFLVSEPRSELGVARLRGRLSRGLESLMPRGAAQEHL
jgi:hypothetical protein